MRLYPQGVVDKRIRQFAVYMKQTFIKFPEETSDLSHIIILAHYPLNPDDEEFAEGVIESVEWEIHSTSNSEEREVAEARVDYYRDRYANVQVRGCTGGSLLRSSLSATV
jgi:hypothetical protein